MSVPPVPPGEKVLQQSLPLPPEPAGSGLRAVAIGAALTLALTALSLFSNLRYGRYITAASLPNGATFFFVLVLLVNALFRRVFGSRRALKVPELGLIFAMLYISAALPQASVAETLVTLAAAPVQLPKGNPYAQRFEGQAAPWLLVQNPEAAQRFYEGYGPVGGPVPWGVWVGPLLGWTAFVLLLLFALHCLSRFLSHRWVREERVSFPLMDLPLELLGVSSGGGSTKTPLWRNPLLYLGAAIPATMIIVGQFHTWYPWLPAWEQCPSWKVGDTFAAPPWNALRDFTLSFWPLVIGIGYLLNAEVAISIWVFHLFFWAQMVFYASLGYTPEQSAQGGAVGFKPLDWVHNMEFGGALTLAGLMLSTVRKDLRRAWEALWAGKRRDRSTSDEMPIPPWTIAGFLLANIGIFVWSALAGASIPTVAVYLVFLYAIVIALGRMVAAGGLYLVDNGYEPQTLLYGLAGPGSFSRATHFVLSGQEALFGRADMNFLYFAVNESKFADALQMERRNRDWQRWHGAGLAISVLVALFGAYYFLLIWSYRYGAETFRAYPFTWRVPQVMDRTTAFMNALHKGPDGWTLGGTFTGSVITLLLVWLNRTFLWWRLSPFGFAMASSWNVANQIWTSTFLGWLLAALMRRYGGLTGYRALRPFFLGLLLGDAMSVCLMALFECIVGVKAG